MEDVYEVLMPLRRPLAGALTLYVGDRGVVWGLPVGGRVPFRSTPRDVEHDRGSTRPWAPTDAILVQRTFLNCHDRAGLRPWAK